MEYPNKIKKKLKKIEFFNMTDEEKIQKHKSLLKKINKLLNSKDKKLLFEIIEENNID